MTAGVGTGMPGQQLLDRVEVLQAIAEAQERDIQHLIGLLTEGRTRDPWGPACDETDQEPAPYMITINPGRYL